jgi:hypothetical protein
MALAMDSVTQAVTDGKLRVDDMQAALDLLKSGQYDIDVVLRMLSVPMGSVAGGGYMGGDFTGADYASGTGGQWLTVPPGYPNDTYPINLTSGEKFSVKTAGESGGSGGGYSGPSAADIGAAVVGALESKGLAW